MNNKTTMNSEQLKQLFIVRQSQMERTLEFFTVIKRKPESLYEVLRVNEIFTNYIFTGEIDRKLNEKFEPYINQQLEEYKNGTDKKNP